ncbi:MAG TPA: hypothetical protein VKB72_14455 [Steroidobacteraceae bacterium]|nr:hypothetical protein [Steroidobacteraceae bacterium]
MRRALALIVLLTSSSMLLMLAALAGPPGGSRIGGLASMGGTAHVVHHAGPVGSHVRPASHHESSTTNNPVESWCAQQRRSAPECGQTPIAPGRPR